MSTPKLDAGTLSSLKYFHDTREEYGYTPLYALVASLRAAGWPLASISEPLGVSRETPRNWANKGDYMGLPREEVPMPIREKGKEELKLEAARARRLERDRREAELLETYLPQLLALQPLAEALRGPSQFNPEKARASAEYTKIIDKCLSGGVRSQVLADALDVAVITLWARLRRSGLRKTAPSEKVPTWATPGWAATA